MSPFRVATVAVASALMFASPASGAPSPTPIPGGAYQVNAAAGKLGDQLFNGVIRLRVVEVRDATPADHPETLLAPADQRVMVMTAIVRNGTHRNFAELITYSLADRDDVAYVISDRWVKPNPLNIPQGAATRQTAMFPVDKAFVPVKMLVQCPTCNAATRFLAFRVALPAVPAPAEPAPSTTP